MPFLSPKKIILFGFIIILLIAIPLTLYLVQKQQETRSRAVAATTLSFTPSSANATVGQTVTLDISLDPGGTNQVSFVKLIISYDATKLATTGGGLVPNTKVLPSTLQEPVYGPGTISTTLSVGTDPTKVIQAKTTIATITFQALAPTTADIPTKITFGDQTTVLSIAATDQFNENILSTTNPANVTVTGSVVTPTPTSVPTEIPSLTPTLIPTAVTPIPTSTVTGTPVPAQLPTCSNLALDKSSTGTAPYSLTFSAAGTAATGTISKATFIFGDGDTQDITQGGGIGTNSVTAQAVHTYNNAGSFTATATLTDSSGNVSNSSSCTQNITVNTAIAENPTPTVAVPPTTPTPTLPPTGPGDIIINIGILGAILSVAAAALLFAL